MNFSNKQHFLAVTIALPILVVAVLLCGCHGKTKQQRSEYFTSGSREADQRASQRMAKSEQISGSGEGAGEKNVKKAEKGADQAAQATNKLSLFDRLGGEKGITAIVDDFVPRLLEDPRVNFARTGVKGGGLFHTQKSPAWSPTPENVATLKAHFVQFFALASGGPAKYEGKEMKGAHAGMHITNPEFEAAVGDIKASLDKLQIPNQEQKDFLSIIESTRPQVVTER